MSANETTLSIHSVSVTEFSVASGELPVIVRDESDGKLTLCDLGSAMAREAIAHPAYKDHWIAGFHARLAQVIEANRAYILGEDGSRLHAETALDRTDAEIARRRGYGD